MRCKRRGQCGRNNSRLNEPRGSTEDRSPKKESVTRAAMRSPSFACTSSSAWQEKPRRCGDIRGRTIGTSVAAANALIAVWRVLATPPTHLDKAVEIAEDVGLRAAAGAQAHACTSSTWGKRSRADSVISAAELQAQGRGDCRRCATSRRRRRAGVPLYVEHRRQGKSRRFGDIHGLVLQA